MIPIVSGISRLYKKQFWVW